MSRSVDSVAGVPDSAGEIDLRALGATLKRRSRSVLIPTALAFILITIFVNVVSPKYTGESQVLLENQETSFTRPDRVSTGVEQNAQVDQEGVASQVQLVSSPDIARRAIKDLGLAGNPEFDPSARINPLKSLLVLFGLARDPSNDSLEARMTQTFRDKLLVFSPPKTRVITIQFSSKDRDLAARAANVVAELYIQVQSAAKRALAKESADVLAAQIADLRTKLATADADRERYRLQTGLLTGSNSLTISGQQLNDINADLSKARSAQADAQAKASMIREMLRNGKTADVTDVINNDIVRKLWEQRATAQAQLALESRTLLPGHPRVKELAAQVAQYEQSLRSAAKQAATSLENEAKIAGQRVTNLETVLTQQKKAAGSANVDEVRLRALDRTAQGYKDQLESSMTKYQEALSRQSSDATPADARIITRATPPDEASFPKKLPFIAFGTVATLIFSIGFVVTRELVGGGDRIDILQPVARTAPRRVVEAPAAHFVPTPTAIRETETSDVVLPPVEDGTPTATWRHGPGWRGLLAATVDYLKGFGRSAAASKLLGGACGEEPLQTAGDGSVGWDQHPGPAAAGSEPDLKSPLGEVVDRIVEKHVPGRGLHVVGTSLGNEPNANGVLIELGRALAEKGRSILVDLNRTATKLADLVEGDGKAKILTMNGLSELLAGDASFAEVIYRDHQSRLHFVPTGRQEADFRDFDLILDALSETYDFVVMLAPAFPQSEIAKVMAPYADFVVIAATTGPDAAMLDMVEKDLTEAGARQVLVAGISRQAQSRQDVA